MTSELAITVAFWMIVAIFWLIRKVHSCRVSRVRNNIQYSHTGIVKLPLWSVRSALDKFYQSAACTFDSVADGVSAYQRGCLFTFREVDHTVNWHLIPQIVAFGLDSESDKTTVDICYRIFPQVRLSQKAAKQFLACATSEGKKALEMLHAMASKTATVTESGCTSAPSVAGRSAGFAEGLIEDNFERRVQPSEIPRACYALLVAWPMSGYGQEAISKRCHG